MAAADVDVGYVAGHLGLDQPVLAALTTEPTVDLVATLLQAVAAKAHEFDVLYADKLQTDIELENAVRSAESRAQTSKATAENALKEAQQARQSSKEHEMKSQSLENELQVLKAKSSDHEAEVKTLNDKIETLQSSNRTNLSIIESNTKRDQTVADELAKQHQRNVELTRQASALQQSEQNAKGQLNSAKYREDSLKQQLDLARRNAEWLEGELKTKSDEALKYRKEKGARVAQLQRECEDAKSQIDALKRTEQQLRERLESMQAKADEALVKLQKQEIAFATTVDSYKQELDDQRRLVDMSDQLSKKHQERVRELEAEKERQRDNYENEIRRVRLELEQERQTTSQMEAKIQQLEGQLDELHARMDQAVQPSSVPQTPRANGSVMGRPASPFGPFGTPGSVRSKSAVTATQAIEQLFHVKGQLASEKRRNQQLSEELDGMISALEAKAPEIQELQAETDTLRDEIARMSELSQQSFEERDMARKAARKAEGALGSAQSETKILKTQLRDLGTQIQMLVFSIYALEKGVDQLTEEEKFRLQQLEQGEITEEALSDLSDTHQFITQKLVVFKDIKSLQAKNQELMRITRELAEQLESEEALAAKHQAKVDHDKVEKLQQELDHMVEESRSIKSTMESFKAERDMFRRILQQRGHGGDEASMMRSSLDSSQRPPLASIEGDQSEALNEALRKLQSEYDSFRDAQNDVRTDLRRQIDHLSTEKNQLQTERIKAENVELQKRSQVLSETAAKQDIRTQQVAEELIEAKGLLDSMRNETANLKAEKKLWKDIQDRMSRDNEGLIEEKNRLNQILATHQNLENERSVAESEARRKAQEKIDKLERELSDAQRKLSTEADESRNLQLRKEFEAKESQRRIDELMQSLSQIREEHVSVKTTKDHLQARVDELTVELRNAEERVGRLQPRPTPRPALASDNNQRQQELESDIQDLNNEVSDLKRDLDLANTKLENAKAQVEQYKELSQSNEEAVEDLRASQDQYREEMESLVAEKEAKVKELEQRVGDMSAELSRSNSELSALRDSQNEVSRRHGDEKAILQEELDRLKEDSAKHVEAARYHQQDLRAQAEIASKAQQDYEQELVKHAEAAKLAQQLRSEYNELKSQTASLRAEAESAKVALSQNESSWDERRQQLEHEMTEVTARREDVNAQNKLLHQQLEALTAQVAALQQKRGGGEDDEAMSPAHIGDALDGLRELNSYLRREKEILEVQYDLKSQESKRLQQQVEYIQSQLDEARLKLDQERAQSAHGGRNAITHQNLMEKLNELNLYRESSAALRNENTQLKDQLADKNKKIEVLEGKIQPLEAEIDSLSTSKSYLEEEIKQIQEDRDRWQKRTEGILTKYGRVDPAEMESLKMTIEELQTERNALREGEGPLRAKVAELESTINSEREAWQSTRSKLTDQFKERSKRLTGEKNEYIQLSNQLQEQLNQVNVELEGAQKRAEEVGLEKTELEKEIESFRQQVQELRQQAQQDQQAQPLQQAQEARQAQGAQLAPQSSASTEVVAQLERRLADAQKDLEAISAQKLGADQQLETLRTELQATISERDEARQKLQDATSGPPGLSDEERKSLEEKVAVAEAQVAELEERVNSAQQAAKERCDKMRDSLNNKLKESRGKFDEELRQKDEDLRLRIEQERLIWQAENQGAKPAAPEQMPSTPATDGQSQPSQATPAPGGSVADLTQLDDASIRQFLASNATVKSIIAANLKKRLEAESAKIKGDVDTKIASARDQAQLMESKKSTLRINMAENKLKAANTRLGVVETAAKETPEKPVVEVWEVVKKIPGPGGPAPPATPVKAVPATPASAGSSQQPDAAAPKQATAKPAEQAAEPAAQESKPAEPQQQQPASSSLPAKPTNPFAQSANANKMEPQNPFALKAEPAANASPGNQVPHQNQQQGQGGPRSSGIPMPRGGGRGRGGAYVPPGQRSGSGNQDGGPGNAAQAGRGRGRGGINPGATEFQPGTKRQRGESEGGRGAKRVRGGH
ncbi:TPR/MLP1/MLP2-like protein [Hirsutella rhossiliensis]|uniref:TPR/MLP1/MLP2-like protein n=1 Tax=Hirsutella rhossiliensis TaxID=111463 RepID=A0A9P8SCF6_9HYPO|nr:TPR/MLP1/MLP2-like protein [Hirsutella rhossiliensis]KAH0957588.1 TPR/MLP1/MLP2-like protein [Hirsutella rhossiliensis]